MAQVARGDQYALLLIEPDHYQRLLSEIGIDSADALAAALAARLSEKLDEGSLPPASASAPSPACCAATMRRPRRWRRKLRAAYASHVFNSGERSASVTASIGGVQIGEKIASVGPVLTRATDGLQTATNLGGNRIEIFDPGAVDRAEEERVQNWVKRLQEALQDGSFRLHYQPVVNLQGEPGEIYEALLRLESNGEVVLPQSFIGIAEENGLLDAIDRWVVNHAIEVLAERKRAGRDTRLVVKVSPASFADNRLLDLIARQLAALDVPGDRLWLQTPEAKVFTAPAPGPCVPQTAAAKLGCQVGLEHFGAGLTHSSCCRTSSRPSSRSTASSARTWARTPSTSRRSARSPSVRRRWASWTVAEHVQDAATMAFLFTASLDYVEGNFLAAPGPAMNYDFS